MGLTEKEAAERLSVEGQDKAVSDRAIWRGSLAAFLLSQYFKSSKGACRNHAKARLSRQRVGTLPRHKRRAAAKENHKTAPKRDSSEAHT